MKPIIGNKFRFLQKNPDMFSTGIQGICQLVRQENAGINFKASTVVKH